MLLLLLDLLGVRALAALTMPQLPTATTATAEAIHQAHSRQMHTAHPLAHADIATARAELDVAPLAAMSYASLGTLETRKKLREVPLSVVGPRGLIGSDPFESVKGATTKLRGGLGSWQ